MKIGVLFCLVFLLTATCAAQAGQVGVSDPEVQAVAEPILNGIFDGMKSNSYAVYSKDFDHFLRESISEEKFLKVDQGIEASLGTCLEKTFLGFLSKGEMTLALWKAEFDKSKDDILIKLILSKRGEKVVVTGLWFQ